MSKLPIPFNNPATYKGHSGVDYPQPRGTIFPSSGSGVVTALGYNARGGNYIWVKYDNGPEVGYHHMDSHNGCPRVGERIGYGDRLGYVGNTGNSTGPHLHSEVAGFATTSGYWQFFDASNVVVRGGNGSAPLVEKETEDMDFINIVGREGSYHAGTFGIYRGNNNGVLYARRLTTAKLTEGIPTLSNEAFAEFRKAVQIIGL